MNRADLLAAAVSVIGIIGVAHTALAQGDVVRIVQAGDGTLYLLKNGARAIAAEAIDEDELALYSDAGAISGTQLVAALSSSSTSLSIAQPDSGAPQAGMGSAQTDADGAPTDSADPAAANPPAAPPSAQQQQPCVAQPAGAKRPTCNSQTVRTDSGLFFTTGRAVAASGTASVSIQTAPDMLARARLADH